MLFRRFHKNRPFLVAERFVAPAARLSGLVLPLDVIARQPVARLRILVLAEGSPEYRVTTLSNPRLSPGESLRLEFAPFDESAGTSFLLGALELSGVASEAESPVEADLRALRATSGRPPIALQG